MDGWRTRRDETGVRSGAAGTEVGIALVQSSPWISLTGSLLSTCICRPVRPCPQIVGAIILNQHWLRRDSKRCASSGKKQRVIRGVKAEAGQARMTNAALWRLF